MDTTNMYVIKISDEYECDKTQLDRPSKLYRVEGFNSLVFDENGLKKLTPLDDYVQYDDDFKKQCIDQGHKEAWDLAEKILNEVMYSDLIEMGLITGDIEHVTNDLENLRDDEILALVTRQNDIFCKRTYDEVAKILNEFSQNRIKHQMTPGSVVYNKKCKSYGIIINVLARSYAVVKCVAMRHIDTCDVITPAKDYDVWALEDCRLYAEGVYKVCEGQDLTDSPTRKVNK